jgi:hypothetical protein
MIKSLVAVAAGDTAALLLHRLEERARAPFLALGLQRGELLIGACGQLFEVEALGKATSSAPRTAASRSGRIHPKCRSHGRNHPNA